MISSFWSRSIFDVSNILDFAAVFIVRRKHEDTIFGLVKPKETEIQFLLLWCDNVAISEDGLTTSQIFYLSRTFLSLSLLRFQQSGSSLPSSGSIFFSEPQLFFELCLNWKNKYFIVLLGSIRFGVSQILGLGLQRMLSPKLWDFIRNYILFWNLDFI